MNAPPVVREFTAASRQQMEATALREQMAIVFGDALRQPEHQNIMILPPLPGSDRYLLAVTKGGVPEVYGDARDDQVKRLFGMVAGLAGRELNGDSPRIDVTVPLTGERIHIDWPPIVAAPQCSIRKPYAGRITLCDYVAQNVGTHGQIDRLRAIVRDRESLLISGSVGTGKTTLLRALSEEPDVQHGLPAFVQDPVEFVPSAPFAISFEADRFGGEATSTRSLVMNCLRWPVTHLFIGEARGREMLEVTEAASTGNPIYSTLHARDAVHALTRAAQMVGMAGIAMDATQMRWVAEAFRWVCHVARVGGKPRIAAIVQVRGYDPAAGFLTTPVGDP